MTAPSLADAPPPSRTVDLGHGVVATMRPWSGFMACALDVQLAIDAERVVTGDLGPWRPTAEERELLHDPEMSAGVAVLLATAARAALRIASWNVVNADGRDEPVDRFSVARLFWRGVTGSSGSSGADHLQAFAVAEEQG